MDRRIRIDMAYDGTEFHGWQVQPDLRTIQGTLQAILSDMEGTPVHVEPSAPGYKLEFKIQTFDVEMSLARDMSLQSEGEKGSASDRRGTDFQPGPQGFPLISYRLGEDGDFKPGNRIILTYTYQNVGGYQLPGQVAINRESHHESWHYKLTDCTVQATK